MLAASAFDKYLKLISGRPAGCLTGKRERKKTKKESLSDHKSVFFT